MCWEVHGPEFKQTVQCGCEPFSGHVSLHRWVQKERKAGPKKAEFLFIFNLLLPHFTFWGGPARNMDLYIKYSDFYIMATNSNRNKLFCMIN